MTTLTNKSKPVYTYTDFVNGGHCLTVKIQHTTVKTQEGAEVNPTITSETRKHYWDRHNHYQGSHYTKVERLSRQAEAIEDMLADPERNS